MTRGPAAPLDPGLLGACIAPLGDSRTLPAEAYVSDGVFEWELEHVFEESWVCVGRSHDLAKPGDHRGVRAGREPILLTRSHSGALRAFFNVCRHRGHELVETGTAASARAIRCPYHGWTYALDGTLRAAPHFARTHAFDPSDHSLVAAHVAQWHGWIFVNCSEDATGFEGHAGDLEDVVRSYEPERLVRGSRCRYDVGANWKIVVENYHECYHCPHLHPQLCRVSPPDSGCNFRPRGAWIGGWMELAPGADTMSLNGESEGVTLRGVRETARRRVYYVGLLPNLLVSLHPDYVLTHRIEPLAPDRSVVECEWLFAPDAVSREGFDPAYARDFWDVTNRQDWAACEAVQRGVKSRGYRQGPLSAREDAVYDFVSTIARSYLEGRLVHPAARGAASRPAPARGTGVRR